MAESDTRRNFKEMCAPLDPRNVENSLSSEVGTPDMNMVGRWVELKYKRRYPARASTAVRFDHYTDAQRRWLLQRSEAGEECYLVIQVYRDWYVWNARGAQTVGFQTKAEMIESALAYWPRKPTSEEMLAVLRPTT